MRKITLLLFPLLFSFSTCGHRGNPLPPLTKKPSPPIITEKVQDFNRPLIVWRKVTTYEDGRKIPNPSEVHYEVVVNFGKETYETDKNYFLDSPINVGEKRCYKVISIYKREKNESKVECLLGRKPIMNIPKINVEAGDGLVKVYVKNPLMRVEVFRNQEFPFVKPYATFKGSFFIDKNVKNGKRYNYRFRFSKSSVKGRLTEPCSITPQDRIPPLPPPKAYLVKSPVCTLFWEPSPSKDVVDYVVKTDRREIRVSGIYLTFKVCPKKVAIYAVDKSGNLSKPAFPEVLDEKGCSSDGK